MGILSDLAREIGLDVESLRGALTNVGESEALTPNYLTTNPDGTVGASFTGHVHAQGLDLDAAPTWTTPVPAQNRLAWLNTLGELVAGLVGSEEVLNVNGTTRTALIAAGGATDQPAYIRLQSNHPGAPFVDSSYAIVGANGIEKILLDYLGRSDFLQLPTTQKLRVAFGVSPAFNWSGLAFSTVPIPHGLGVMPQWAMTSSGRAGDALAGDARAPWLTAINSMDAINISTVFSTKNSGTIGVFAVPAGACSWIAIG